MSPDRRLQPPSGMAPPRTAVGPGGEELDLVTLAAEACARYHEEYPDEDARYGDAGQAWCRHDIQHLLNWGALDLEGLTELDREVAWLAKVLEAREFPLDRLARGLELAADVVGELVPDGEALVAVLRGAAAMIRDHGTFLD